MAVEAKEPWQILGFVYGYEAPIVIGVLRKFANSAVKSVRICLCY